jgi:hypothetical protein
MAELSLPAGFRAPGTTWCDGLHSVVRQSITDAISYFRGRPGEPEVSDTAMRIQRDLVQRNIDVGGIRVVAEFVEKEDGASNREIVPVQRP